MNLDDVDADGFLVKHELVDLMNIADPARRGRPRHRRLHVPVRHHRERHPPRLAGRIGVLNDNNYPGSSGRTPGEPDNNEFIVVKLDEPLPGHHGHGHGPDQPDREPDDDDRN